MQLFPILSSGRVIIGSQFKRKMKGTLMKKSIITIAILFTLASSAIFGQVAERAGSHSAEWIATNMIEAFDADESAALNKLELASAIEHLSQARPYLVHDLDFTASGLEMSAPPRIAFGLVEGFDSDSDYQLTREELSLAISYLRRLNQSSLDTVAMAD